MSGKMAEELPVGFTMHLTKDIEALRRYAELPKEKQMELIEYVKQPAKGEEARYRIENIIYKLHNHMM